MKDSAKLSLGNPQSYLLWQADSLSQLAHRLPSGVLHGTQQTVFKPKAYCTGET